MSGVEQEEGRIETFQSFGPSEGASFELLISGVKMLWAGSGRGWEDIQGWEEQRQRAGSRTSWAHVSVCSERGSFVSWFQTQPAPLLFCRKLCYAIGGAPYQLTGNALGFFLQIFLLDVVQLEPFHSSLILFLGRAWDAVTDPAVGFLVSKSPRRKLGKLIPWIVCSTPFGVVFYCMVWSTPSDAMPVSLKFLWYLAMYCFFQTSMSCYHVPYSSLTMFLGGNPRDRDSATAYRMGVEVFSTLVGSGIQGQIVGGYHASMMKSCSMPNGTLYNSTSPGLTDTLENTGVHDRLRGPGLALLHGLPDSLPWSEGAARAPQSLGKDPAALLSQPANNPGTPALCPAALWLPLHVPGLPDRSGDLCLFLHTRCWAGWEVPALDAHHAGRGFPLHSLLAVVSGAFWEKTSCVRGPTINYPCPHRYHPSEPQLPGLRLHGGISGMQPGCPLLVTLVHATGRSG
ncbi:uncharacterized protein [Lepidochelys kempii]|uniref:uncharacterized protein isoform X9 n=1 Tax=Lepidochelys kempii TaxID=8472 RepID=UPI003C6F8BE3